VEEVAMLAPGQQVSMPLEIVLTGLAGGLERVRERERERERESERDSRFQSLWKLC
jgi:hypothetical protein